MLIIDEMQDYSPIQYKVIQKLYTCRKTILGDASQSVNPYGSSTADMIQKAFVTGEIMKLCKSYRSTYKITDFAQKIKTNTEIDRSMLYIAVIWAMHLLTITYSGEFITF